MKHTSYRRRRTAHREHTPGFAAWALLIAAWIVVLPFAVSVGHALFTVSETEAETLSPQTPAAEEPAVPALSASYRRVPALRSLRGSSPAILIYHTHTTEAYWNDPDDPYRENGAFRTRDNTKNIVAVGEVLKNILETTYGFTVIHDTTDHEPPKLATAYERSLATMQKYKEQYPQIVLYLDLHRDAYNSANAPTDYLTVNGTETARLMFVVGRGDKYAEKPYFDSDYALAQRITDHLNAIAPKLARPIRVKPGRYNQHVAPNCLLAEVGHNANTLEQAKAAMPFLAESIAFAFAALQEPANPFVPN